MRLLLPQGAASAPRERAGVTEVAMGVFLDGLDPLGSGRSFRDTMGRIGAEVSYEVGQDHVWVGVDGFARDTARMVESLLALAGKPSAPVDRFDAWRDLASDRLAELAHAPRELRATALAAATFGAGHPYAIPALGAREPLRKLTRAQVLEELRRVLAPEGATLVVVGDVSGDAVAADAAAFIERWPDKPRPSLAPIPPLTVSSKLAPRVVARAGAATTELCAARTLADAPIDREAADALAYVLGGGESSRLGRALGDAGVLAGAPFATVARGRAGPSLVVCASVEAGRTARGLALFLQTLDAMRLGPTDAELSRAQAALEAAHEAADEIEELTRATLSELIGEAGPDRPEKLRAVSVARVRELAERGLEPSTRLIVLSGRPDEARAALSAAQLALPVEVTLADLSAAPAQAAPVEPPLDHVAVEAIENAEHEAASPFYRVRFRARAPRGAKLSAARYELVKVDSAKRERGERRLGAPEVVSTEAKGKIDVLVLQLQFEDGWPAFVNKDDRYILRVDGTDSEPFKFETR